MKENSIEEALEKLSTGKKIKMYELLRTFKREGIENFVITRKKYIDVILSDYKRALKENEHKTEKIENQKAVLAILNEKQKDFNKLQNTLSSYKGQFRRQEKEIEELKDLIAHKNEYTKKLEEDLFENSNNYVIPIQKVKEENKKLKNQVQRQINAWNKDIKSNYISKHKIKDKIEEEKLPLTIVGGRKNKKTLEYGIKLGRRQALQELIEEREEK